MINSAELLQRGYVSFAPELGNVSWKKSTKSQGNSNCVELAEIGKNVVAIRDSKNKNGPALTFSRTDTADFISYIKSGGLDDI